MSTPPIPPSPPSPPTFTPVQQIEQQEVTQAVEVDELLAQAYPSQVTITEEQKKILAYEIWEANGAVQQDPLTLNNWLEAEVILESQS